MFDPAPGLLLGLFAGVLFGFLLQKGRVTKFGVIVGQLLLRDWTVAKIMLTAVAVGSVGVYGMVAAGMGELNIKPALMGGIIFGGLLFGVGLAVLGYCPGTSVAASGEGHRDAMMGVAGMIAGSFAYVWLYPAVDAFLRTWPDWGKVTLPQVSGASPWLWIAGLLTMAVAAYLWKGRQTPHTSRR
jgi:uncharacterized protein